MRRVTNPRRRGAEARSGPTPWRVVAAVDAAVMAPGSAHRLVMVRAVLLATIGLRIAVGPYTDLGDLPAGDFDPPVVLSWLSAVPPVGVMVALQVVGVTAAGWGLRRTGSRGAVVVAWLSLLFLAGLRTSAGKILHNDVLLLIAAIPMGFTPRDLRRSPARRPDAGWPVRAAMLAVAAVYFCAGVQKLRYSGLDWVASDNMRHVMYQAAASGRPKTDVVALAIADRGWLSRAAAASILTLELAAPAALLHWRARGAFALAAVALHAGTYVTLGIDYWAWILTVVAVMTPWDRFDLGARRRDPARTARAPAPVTPVVAASS